MTFGRSFGSTVFKGLRRLRNQKTTVHPSARSRPFSSRTLEQLILLNTMATTDHLTPELRLRLITPDCEAWHSKASDSVFPDDPFWGIYWPGGQALSRFLLDNGDVVRDKNVLDVGSGSGACAIAAVKSGAKLALANDIDPVSLEAIKMNAQLNNVTVSTTGRNLIGESVDSMTLVMDGHDTGTLVTWDVILVGDMFYDCDFSNKLFQWLVRLVRMGKTVLVGDPGRHALHDINERQREIGQLVKIFECDMKKIEHNGFPTASVYRVEKT